MYISLFIVSYARWRLRAIGNFTYLQISEVALVFIHGIPKIALSDPTICVYQIFSRIQLQFFRNALRFRDVSGPHGFRYSQKFYQSRVSIDEVR